MEPNRAETPEIAEQASMPKKLPDTFLNGLPVFYVKELPRLGPQEDVFLWSGPDQPLTGREPGVED